MFLVLLLFNYFFNEGFKFNVLNPPVRPKDLEVLCVAKITDVLGAIE